MSSQFKFNWSQFKFLNLILNCIKKKNRGTSSIQLNFLIHQLTVWTSSRFRKFERRGSLLSYNNAYWCNIQCMHWCLQMYLRGDFQSFYANSSMYCNTDHWMLLLIGQKKASSHSLVFTRHTRNRQTHDIEKSSGPTHLFKGTQAWDNFEFFWPKSNPYMPFINFRKKFRFFSFDFRQNFDVRTFPRWLSIRETNFFLRDIQKIFFF
jgi:hypothetical protein